jgi:hypothetical protein
MLGRGPGEGPNLIALGATMRDALCFREFNHGICVDPSEQNGPTEWAVVHPAAG